MTELTPERVAWIVKICGAVESGDENASRSVVEVLYGRRKP